MDRVLTVPASVRHARAAFDDGGITSVIQNDELGGLLRGLTASKLGVVMLVSGSTGCDAASWMIDGMDISCRLVVHYEPEFESRWVAAAFNNDLRVTIHEQPFVAFLDDVAQHRFGMLVLAPPVLDETTLGRAITAIDDGGFLVILSGSELVDLSDSRFDDFALVQQRDSNVVLVRRHPGNQPRRRGGRRRERAGAT